VKIEPFALERYFARHEFSAPALLSCSDCDGLGMAELLALADEECRALWEGLRLGYTESRGLPRLRAEIAALCSGPAPDDVLVAAPEECIFIAMSCLLEPGDHVVCTFPGYASLYQVAAAMGCEVTRWQPDEDHGWRFDPAALQQLLRPDTRLVVLNFPHNPTGWLPAREEFAEMVAMARGCGARVFSDEMYRFLEHEPAQRLPSAVELWDQAISLSGMSKSLGLAGLRIGWLCTRDAALLERMAAFKDYITICSSAPSEILALIGLRARATILQRHRARIARNLEQLDRFFARHRRTFRWQRPRAGTVGLVRLCAPLRATSFCERALERGGVMLVPSTLFDYGDEHVRIGFGREDLPEALARLEAVIDWAPDA
jgi:aspartate/methionine/tyrosine aminotransferase